MKKKLVAGVLAGCLLFSAPAVASPDRGEMEGFARETARNLEISEELVLAVIDQESTWNVRADNGVCKGLMQLNPNTGKWCASQLGIEWNPFDYKCNIQCGTFYLRYIYDSYKAADWEESYATYATLIAYNRGIAGANKWMQNHDIFSNGYAKSVMNKKFRMEQEIWHE